MKDTLDKEKTEFAREVLAGLSKENKELPTKYIYDDIGDVLFQKIMDLPEYYLTRAEFEIFEFNKTSIAKEFCKSGPFRLVELGAGDGIKSKVLIRELLGRKANFTYCPVDFSPHVLKELEETFTLEFPSLKIEPLALDYFAALQKLKVSADPTIVMFLVSNLGNFSTDSMTELLQKISGFQKDGDGLFLGVDMMKDPKTILSAYNDSQGVTAAFNKNLLTRINQELDGDFDLDEFYFYPNYDPIEGSVKSYLVSGRNQKVFLKAVNELIEFKRGEVIFTEISQKFNDQKLRDLKKAAQYVESKEWRDCTHGFRNLLWKKST